MKRELDYLCLIESIVDLYLAWLDESNEFQVGGMDNLLETY